MAGPSPVELTADCEACLLEGGVVEVYDPLVPACRFGLPASTRCRLCGIEHAGVLSAALPRENELRREFRARLVRAGHALETPWSGDRAEAP